MSACWKHRIRYHSYNKGIPVWFGGGQLVASSVIGKGGSPHIFGVGGSVPAGHFSVYDDCFGIYRQPYVIRCNTVLLLCRTSIFYYWYTEAPKNDILPPNLSVLL